MDLRVVIYQEGDAWTAQCVDYDIGTSGSDISQTQKRFENQVLMEAVCSLENTGKLFGGIPPAPREFEAMWSECHSHAPLTASSSLSAKDANLNVTMQLCA